MILFPDERIPCQRGFITEENDIRDMWADHFEALGGSFEALKLV